MANNDVLNAGHLEARVLALNEQNLKSSPTVPPSTPSSERQQNSRDSHNAMRLLSLQTILQYLKALPREDAIEVLGTEVNDAESTSFLKSFYKAYPLFPDEHFWECRLSLVCHAVKIAHPSYSKADLVSVFEELQASAVYIPASMFTLVACALLQKTLIETADGYRPSIAVKDIWAAAGILDDMALRGENVMTEEIVTSVQVAVIIALIP